MTAKININNKEDFFKEKSKNFSKNKANKWVGYAEKMRSFVEIVSCHKMLYML